MFPSNLIGSLQQHPVFNISDNSYKKAIEFKPRDSDCFISTPPKTGTTLLQYITHLLRTVSASDINHDLLFKDATNFESIDQVVPWPMLAWDLGYDITDTDYEQRCQVSNQKYPVRLFKSHQRLLAMNPGAKYICAVRNPQSACVSMFQFLKGKDVPFVRKYNSASEWAFDKTWHENNGFGTSLWEYFNDYLSLLKDPNVLVVVYEDLAKDIRGHIPTLAKFLGLNVSEKHMDEIARLTSRTEMINNSKFEEVWMAQRLKAINRYKGHFNPGTFVTSGSDKSSLTTEAIQFLDDQWKTKIESIHGIKNYEELAKIIREEFQKR